MKKIVIYISSILILFSALLSSGLKSDDKILDELRKKYYSALEVEDEIDNAIKAFQETSKEREYYAATAKVYIGSLTAVKAKFAFWPGTKLEYANQGIEMMEEGLKDSNDNIESLFIYGTTCYYLPFFFGMSEESETALKKIIKIMDKNSLKLFPKDLLKNALIFIEENIDLDDEEKKSLEDLKVMLNG